MPQITYSRKRTYLAAFPASANKDAPPAKPAPPPKATTLLKEQKITSLFAPKPAKPAEVPPARAAKPRLTQMTIDLGANPRRTCKQCGMEYVPSNPEDAKLHLKYHAKVLSGVEVGAAVLKTANKSTMRPRRVLPRKTNDKAARLETEDVVLEVTRRDGAQVRALAERVLEVAEDELGALRTDADALWGQVLDAQGQRHDRHKVYVYINDGLCVGLCLARRIFSARAILAPPASTETLPTPPPSSPSAEGARPAPSSSVSVADKSVPAFLGISRIWVLREARGKGIGADLLQVARKRFALGRVLRKEEAAFSQPTSSGLALARKWFGRREGWLVYDEGGVESYD